EESSARHRTGQPNLTMRCAKGRSKPGVHRRMPGAGLSDGCSGKALSEMPAIQPYWGKPAVRNDRGDHGNVGIIRSPIRATVLPDCGGGDQRWSSLPQQLASGNQIREDAYGIRRLIWSAATYIRDKLNT